MKLSWKEKLYAGYVSTGQAGRRESGNTTLETSNFYYYNKSVRLLLPKDLNCRILDLGCGHGALLNCFKAWGYRNVRGVDASAEQVELAHRYGIQEVEKGDLLDSLKSETSPVDVVFLMDVIEHLERQEIFDLLAEIVPRMTSNGLLVLHMPNAHGIFGSAIRYSDMTHELSFTPMSIGQCLRSNGFGEITIFEDKPIVHGLVSGLRRCIWEIGSFPFRVLSAAECGAFPLALSRNMLVTAKVTR